MSVLLVTALVAALMATGAQTSASGAEEDEFETFDAAPAVATRLLQGAEMRPKYRDGGGHGNHVADVANFMGPGTDFDGIAVSETLAYECVVATFLSEGVVGPPVATDTAACEPAGDDVDAFVTTWNTRLAAGTTVTLALAGTVDATIDWGDGTTTTATTVGPHVRDYGTDGIYTVSVTGTLTGYNSLGNGGAVSERHKLVSVDQWGTTGFTSLVSAFQDATNLTGLPTDGAGTAAVNDMSFMFWGTSSLTTVPMFDTSNATSMLGMFALASSISTVPLFETGNVTSMLGMFYGASSLSTVPLFDTSNVTSMYIMFEGASSLSAVPPFDTGNVTSMYGMFDGASSLSTVPLFDTGNVTDMQLMFAGASALTEVPLLDTSNVTYMNAMFRDASSLTSVPLLDTRNVTQMNAMFDGASSLTTVPLLDTSNVNQVIGMFRDASSLASIPLLDTSNVGDMNAMFDGASSLTSVPLLDTSNVYDMGAMFRNALSFNADLSGWCVPRISEEPFGFADNTPSWNPYLPPIWGACPA